LYKSVSVTFAIFAQWAAGGGAGLEQEGGREAGREGRELEGDGWSGKL